MNGADRGGGAELEAGRELDARIATEVMGFRWENRTPAGRRRCLVRPDGAGAVDYENGRLSYRGEILPPYSTVIAAAFAVVEELRGRGLTLDLHSDAVPGDPPDWEAVVWKPCYSSVHGRYRIGTGFAATPAHAICLAALVALENHNSPTPSEVPPSDVDQETAGQINAFPDTSA